MGYARCSNPIAHKSLRVSSISKWKEFIHRTYHKLLSFRYVSQPRLRSNTLPRFKYPPACGDNNLKKSTFPINVSQLLLLSAYTKNSKVHKSPTSSTKFHERNQSAGKRRSRKASSFGVTQHHADTHHKHTASTQSDFRTKPQRAHSRRISRSLADDHSI